MNSRNYFDEIALPAVEAALAQPSNKQRVHSAAIHIYHMVDYINADTGKSKSQIIREIEQDFPQFKAIHSLAAASKHTRVDDRRAHNGFRISDLKSPGPVFPTGADGKVRLIFGKKGGQPTLVYWNAPMRIQLEGRYIAANKVFQMAKDYFSENLKRLIS